MASFTMPFWQYAEFKGGKFLVGDDGIAYCEGGNIGLETYPIFKESYRKRLNGVIIDHFWNREIGQESSDMFHHSLRRKLNLIMPMYNQLYENTLLKFDPFNTMDIETITSGDSKSATVGESESTSSGTANSESEGKDLAFPQNQIEQDGDYATSMSLGKSDSASNSVGKEDSKQTQEQQQTGKSRTRGHQGSPVANALAIRSAILNVEQLILNDLNDLFMIVWDTQDNYDPYNDWNGIYS